MGVAFSPDGTRVMTRSGSVARLWSASSGAPVGAVMEHADAVSSAAFSPDGRYVITGSFDKTARLWDAQSGAPFAAVMRHDSPVYCVAFSPDGRRVVTGTGIWLETGVVQLWDAQTGNPVGNAMRHANNIVWSVVFSALTGSSFSREVRTGRSAYGMPNPEPSSGRRYKVIVRLETPSSARTERESSCATDRSQDTSATLPASGKRAPARPSAR